MSKIKLFLFLVIAILFTTCKSDKITPPERLLGEYFPLEMGKYVVYDATRITYTNTVADTVSFQIKEINKGEFKDQEGNTNYRFERFKRKNDSEGWLIDSVWYVIDKKDRIIKVENNISYIKMVYPISNSTKWDVNIMNNNQYNCGGFSCKLEDIASYQNINQSYKIGSVVFEKTVTVNQKGYVVLTDSITSKNVYANGIGRIFTEKINLGLCRNYDSQSNTALCKIGQIMDGYVYRESLVEHGIEK
jgi:hypothetical protein